MHTPTSLLSLSFLLPIVSAQHDHGHGSSSSIPGDAAAPLAHSHMTAFLHVHPFSDALWFQGWVAARPRAVLGACVGLFLLGVAERWVAAVRRGVEGGIAGGMRLREAKKDAAPAPMKGNVILDTILLRNGTAEPFVATHAWARFVLHAFHAGFAALGMLTLMTFQVLFIVSLALGAGFGEMMYGRLG
ncbi:hypothetical protein H0H81_010350 [Sphagnurus paluster]|uniref:Copper transport protein n=1 Tax=Sphagnurus paluster TaxID=117069 RepID=A0A9P7FP01_9AGAR|nr:hypothetical protein H0H81_010350 [Sphagnurus paluster]